MKHPKRLKRWMKELLSERQLNPDYWLYTKNLPGELHIYCPKIGKEKVVLYRENIRS